MIPPPFTTHYAATVPLYHWRGARPWPLDLTPDDTGWAYCLCLQYEGDVCLLPLAWQSDPLPPAPPNSDPPSPGWQTQALDNTAVTLTLNTLQQTGWQITGSLTLRFTGQQTDPNFHQHIQHYLWHTPAEKINEEL